MSDLVSFEFSPDAVTASAPPSLPRVTDAASYAAIPAGSDYLDPAGVKKTKYWKVDPAKPQTYEAVPEGSEYLVAGEDKPRSKPTSENVGFGTQVLFDMASGDPATQKQILTTFYGDNVRQDSQGFYVSQDGKRLRPSASGGGISGGLKRGFADVAAQALPTVGAIAGAGAGSLAGPVGGVAGSALGYMSGTEANRGILALAGFGKPSIEPGRVPAELAEGAMFEAGGQLAGKAAGQLAAAGKYGAQYVAESLGVPWMLRTIGGVTPDVVKRWGPLTEKEFPTGRTNADGSPEMRKGMNLPPQLLFPGAAILPKLSTVGKQYDIDPVTPSLEQYASDEIKSTAEALGIPRSEIGEPLKRTADVDYTPAGEALHSRYADMLAQANADLDRTFTAAETAARGQGAGAEIGRQSALAEAQLALERNQKAARDIRDAGWRDIRTTIAQLRAGRPTTVPGELPQTGRPGDLVRTMAARISATRQAIEARYQNLYGRWDGLYGSRVADVSEPAEAARAFLMDLPDDIQRNHPALIRAIAKLDEADAEGVSADITTGQLRHIRSMLGSIANWQTLAPDFKNGQLKYFRRVIDHALHANLPESGARMLDTLDQGYKTDFAPLHDPTVQKLVDWTEANMPKNAGTAAQTILGAGDETRSYLRGLAGAPVWDAVVGADMQAAMDASKSIYEGEIDGGKFISEFEHRDRSGVLGEYPPSVVEKMRRQAQYVSEITDGGKAPLPVSIRRGDRFSDAMQGIYEAAQRVDRLSKADPLKAMESELKRIAGERKAAAKGLEEQYSTDPLGQILTNPNAMLSQSARRIIRDPQLLETASKRFGADSPEFKLLSRTYIKDVLTHPDVYGLSGVSADLSKLTRAQQEQIFGTKADDVILFAQNVHDILKAVRGSDAGSSIIAATAVTHPASTPLPGMHKLAGVPAGVLRVPLSVVLDYTIRGYTNPAFFRFVAGSLRGSPEERQAARALIRQFTLRGGVAGAGVGSAVASLPQGNPPGATPPPAWSTEYRQRHPQP